MAKDTEKLIRQLSLISYLMAERRPVTAMEIRRDVEGYSGMNEDAFARRFYADRAELESLGIRLTVERAAEGAAEQENYSLRSESFHLPPIAFTDQELAALRTALHLLDGEFAYAEPLRLALQQITWGRPSPLQAPEQQTVALGITASAGGHELSARLAKIETAIFRNKTITFDYYTMERDEVGARKVDPYHLLFQGGQFYLLGHAHEREAVRVFRLSRIQGKVSYATKAEHDFRRPVDFDPRAYADRAGWQLGEEQGTAEILLSSRIAWQIERHFGRYGEMRTPHDGDREQRIFLTPYANPRLIIAWVLGLGEQAQLLGPPSLLEEMQRRIVLVRDRHAEVPDLAPRIAATRAGEHGRPRHSASRRGGESESRADTVIRPERFARLVTLAGILIDAGRAARRLSVAEVCERLQISEEELREDIAVLNVVNFGGGSYVLYAEILEDEGEIEVDPEPYSDNFDRPARLLPVEAKALIAAIDLVGEHIPEGSLASARKRIVQALGEDPMEQGLQVAHGGGDDAELARSISTAIVEHRLVEIDYYKESEDEFSHRRVEPYALVNGREGWYVACFDPEKDAMRHFRLDRIRRAQISEQRFTPRPEVDPAADIDGWMRTGEVPASRTARVWISPARARWARESRNVVEERKDGSVVVALGFAGTDWLVREILKEAGDAVVLEPQDARDAVHALAARLADRKDAILAVS
ncbi:MAG TPA: WYL domain-containing protein [Solirubrobacteraceae bacterium]|jgi:proteasome accessory factor C|nr:WYL domain-containing protein [Solirubrobacteraceae bacterium]